MAHTMLTQDRAGKKQQAEERVARLRATSSYRAGLRDGRRSIATEGVYPDQLFRRALDMEDEQPGYALGLQDAAHIAGEDPWGPDARQV